MFTRLDSGPSTQIPLRTGPSALVIGAGLGGLAAAMRLGAKGYRVTVMDRLDQPGGRGTCLRREGHRFDLGPTIVTAPQILRELWQTCGRDFDSEVDLRALDPFYEIRWEDGSRFTARQDAQDIEAEVARLSPEDREGYARFVADSAKRYTFGFETLGRRPMHRLMDIVKVLPTFATLRADRSVHAHVARRIRDPRLRMALSFHPLFIGGDPFRVTSIYTLVSHLEKAFGVHYVIGGVAELAAAMARVIEGQGGRFLWQTEADEVILKQGRACAVRTRGGDTVEADLIVSNADAGHTYETLLRNAPRRRWTKAKLRKSRWSMGLFVWYFGTKGTRDKWKDVGHHTILNGPRYEGLVRDIFRNGRLSDDMSLYVHRPAVTDPTVAPDGDDTFYALSPVPHLGHADPVDWQTEAEPYRQKVLDTLERQLLPGLRQHLTASEVFTPETFRDRYLSPFGSGFSIEPRILQSAWFRPHNVVEEVPGLFLVGAGTHPGAGLPGVISSAEVLGQLVPDAAEVAIP
ncbi:phytoene desaturase [Maritimibacter sp. UBA3975]|uniref:phytoene desaturase n=1 Tax=Maritimibacter sp. UBA3975 TaxID=1946833 RepID=UPI000C0A5BC5|nr:phytoene desaturase [Maritimibacter sp. UBA3975]MAM62936.1 phytoene dehydrogenase [Maritimibacter sp.]|tara:strand:+ start:45703 stop:47256 length:1554 start_codon:yes stop_codon:yes gene_type:complete